MMGMIEVKSFGQRYEMPSYIEQAAGYARKRGLVEVTLVLFVPTDEEEVVRELCGDETIGGVVVHVVAVGQG